MITIYEWSVTNENDTLLAIGRIAGTAEEAEAWARKSVFPTGKPLTSAERNYKFDIQQVIRPRHHGHTETDYYTRPEKERLSETLQRRHKRYNV